MANKPNLLQQRFQAIESLLIWEGQVTNARLRQLFGLQSVQASRLISEYRDRYPKAIALDTRYKRFIPQAGFRPKLVRGSIDEYTHWVRTMAASDDLVFEEARVDLTLVSPRIFSVLREACVRRKGVRINYESMNRPTGSQRVIFPQRIVRVGRRWHTRAWCCERREYRDFALGRIRTAALETSEATAPASEDIGWTTLVEISLIAHHGMDAAQQRVIRNEYFEGARRSTLNARACLVPYVLQDLRAAVDTQRQRPPDYQLEVANAKTIRRYLFP